jgi:hypothetical protein
VGLGANSARLPEARFVLFSPAYQTFEATAVVAEHAELAFAQFVILTPFPGTVDFEAWEKKVGDSAARAFRATG